MADENEDKGVLEKMKDSLSDNAAPQDQGEEAGKDPDQGQDVGDKADSAIIQGVED